MCWAGASLGRVEERRRPHRRHRRSRRRWSAGSSIASSGPTQPAPGEHRPAARRSSARRPRPGSKASSGWTTARRRCCWRRTASIRWRRCRRGRRRDRLFARAADRRVGRAGGRGLLDHRAAAIRRAPLRDQRPADRRRSCSRTPPIPVPGCAAHVTGVTWWRGADRPGDRLSRSGRSPHDTPIAAA